MNKAWDEYPLKGLLYFGKELAEINHADCMLGVLFLKKRIQSYENSIKRYETLASCLTGDAKVKDTYPPEEVIQMLDIH